MTALGLPKNFFFFFINSVLAIWKFTRLFGGHLKHLLVLSYNTLVNRPCLSWWSGISVLRNS